VYDMRGERTNYRRKSARMNMNVYGSWTYCRAESYASVLQILSWGQGGFILPLGWMEVDGGVTYIVGALPI
jgi:hypothetical protein